jgi:hypothetical protein
MNHKNERIKKLWNGGMRNFTQIAKKCGLPDSAAGRDRVRLGLEWCQARQELNPPFAFVSEEADVDKPDGGTMAYLLSID